MTFKLYWKKIKLGTISESAQDFPSFYGALVQDAAFTYSHHSEAVRLKQFLDLLKQEATLTEVEHEQDVAAQIDDINQRLDPFTDLIDGNDWCLIDPQHRITEILSPMFYTDGMITWRLRF